MSEQEVITLQECLEMWKAFEIPGPRPHPCVYFSEAEIEEIRRLSEIGGTRQFNERKKVLEAAQVLLARDLSIAQRGWQGGARWACVNCGTREVEIRRDSPDRGICLRCGTVNDDTEFKSWWAVEMHGRSLHQLRILTWAYIFTNDSSYADKALQIMTQYADWLPRCQVLDKGRISNRVRFSVDPQLDQRFGIQMAYSYDLLYNYSGWTERMRSEFENEVLHSTVVLNIERWPEFWPHNMYNTGCVLLVSVGLCLGKPDYVDRGVNGEHGLFRSLLEGVNEDGFWLESSLNYHLAVVRDIVKLTEALYHAGFDFYRVDTYRNMFIGPLKLAEPTTGVMPSWGDGSCIYIDKDLDFGAAYEIFYHRTGDHRAGAYLKTFSDRGRLSFGPLYIEESRQDADIHRIEPASVVLNTQGLAALHAGEGDDAQYLRLNYLRRIGGHHQADRLNLIVHAMGGFVGSKLTGSDYCFPTYYWSKEAIGHNTVCIGGKSQNEKGGGEFAYAALFDGVQVVSARLDSSYEGYRQQRTAVMFSGRYIVDLFHIEGAQPDILDWIWHCKGELDRPVLATMDIPKGEGAYSLIEDAATVRNDDPWRATWKLNEPDSGRFSRPVCNPYEELWDWPSSTEDYNVRIKPDGNKVKLYNNCTGYGVFPTPILSPVISSLYHYGSEFPINGDKPRGAEEVKKHPFGYFTVNMPGSRKTDIYYAAGPGYGFESPNLMPLIIVRRNAASTTFMAALEAYKKDSRVLSAQTLFDENEAAAVKVSTNDSQEVIVANYGADPVGSDIVSLSGRLGIASVRAGKVSWVLLVEASSLKVGSFFVECSQPRTCFVDQDCEGNWRAFNEAGGEVSVIVHNSGVE